MKKSLKNQKNKINLVYIVSNGRSGSTLLELLLNTNSNIWSVGELNVLPWELEKSTCPCGCGEYIKNCEFWQEVSNKLDINKKIFSPFRKAHGARKVIRWKYLWSIIKNKKPKGEKFKEFCNLNLELLKNIKESTKRRNNSITHIISSSKGPYRLFWLNNCENINVKVIHIIKDPRAFVYSMTKNESGIRAFVKSLRMIVRYLVENWIITKVSKTISKDNFKLIRYEDLASNYKEKMKEITDWLGVEKEWNLKSFREKENHGIAGNMMRFEFKDIILDEKWKYKLNPFIKKIVILTTYFSAEKYGYFK